MTRIFAIALALLALQTEPSEWSPEITVSMIRTDTLDASTITTNTLTSALGQEVAVPGTPVDVTVKAYKMISILSERKPDWRFVLRWEDDHGTEGMDVHFGACTAFTPPEGGPTVKPPTCAEDLIRTFNTANFSTNSLTKRALQHLIAHGKIPPSTVQGVPEPAPTGDPFGGVQATPVPKPPAPLPTATPKPAPKPVIKK